MNIYIYIYMGARARTHTHTHTHTQPLTHGCYTTQFIGIIDESGYVRQYSEF